MGNRPLVAACVLVLAACGGSSGSGPGPVTPAPPGPPAATSWSIAGSVVDAISGQGVAGASLTFTGFPSTITDASGRWQLQGSGSSPGVSVFTPTITASGFVTRETRIEWKSGGRTDVAVSLLPERAPFSLDFYRMLVRNGHEEPAALEPVRRWSVNPNFYLNAHNPRTNEKLTASEVDAIERSIRDAIPQLTGGQLSVGAFEVGVADRAQRTDWINIQITYDPNEDYCGRAFVGANPGLIMLNYDRCRTNWCREGLSPNVIAHEVGHAMGFWHTPEGVMVGEFNECSSTTFSEAERVHARLAYMRPNGNLDTDKDPATFMAFTTENTPEVICYRPVSSARR